MADDKKEKGFLERWTGSLIPTGRGLLAPRIREVGDAFGNWLTENFPHLRDDWVEALTGAFLQNIEANRPKHWFWGEMFESFVDVLERGVNEFFQSGADVKEGKSPEGRGTLAWMAQFRKLIEKEFSEPMDSETFEEKLDDVLRAFDLKAEFEWKLEEREKAEIERRRSLTADDYDKSWTVNELMDIAARFDVRNVYKNWSKDRILARLDEHFEIDRTPKPEKEPVDINDRISRFTRGIGGWGRQKLEEIEAKADTSKEAVK